MFSWLVEFEAVLIRLSTEMIASLFIAWLFKSWCLSSTFFVVYCIDLLLLFLFTHVKLILIFPILVLFSFFLLLLCIFVLGLFYIYFVQLTDIVHLLVLVCLAYIAQASSIKSVVCFFATSWLQEIRIVSQSNQANS